METSTYYVIIEGGRAVASLMTTDDVIKTVMSQKWRAAHVRESQY